MTQNDKNKPVMVTGASGYVAGWLVKRLLDEGYSVHACVRDPADSSKLKYLNEIARNAPGQVQFFKSDLLEPGSYREGMQDCQVVFHTASPFTLDVDDAQAQLVDPAYLGTQNVLQQANMTNSVRRVVVTSSTTAIFGDNADIQWSKTGKISEQDWNTSSSLAHQPYSYSKTLAEKEAWKIAAAQSRWELVTVNPSFVLGPGINPFATSETFTLFKQFGDGTAKTGVPDYPIGAVDVRDVANAHLAAAFSATAKGRYIACGCDTSLIAMANILRAEFGDGYPFPRRTLPKWLVWIAGPQFNKSLTRKIISRNVGVPLEIDNSKSVAELGMSYRPLEESVTELFQQLIDNGMA